MPLAIVERRTISAYTLDKLETLFSLLGIVSELVTRITLEENIESTESPVHIP
jgi:hypothetical protein